MPRRLAAVGCPPADRTRAATPRRPPRRRPDRVPTCATASIRSAMITDSGLVRCSSAMMLLRGECRAAGARLGRGRDNGLLDLRTRKPRRQPRQCWRVELRRIETALARRWIAAICSRALACGKSTKKISSKRPLRISSGGSCEMSLAVATMNTGWSRSESQVSNDPSTRRETPPSWSPPPVATPFSISSIHRMQGAMPSAAASAVRRLRSVSPQYLLYRAPKSSRISGTFQIAGDRARHQALAAALHVQQDDPLRPIHGLRALALQERLAPEVDLRFKSESPPSSANRTLLVSKPSTPAPPRAAACVPPGSLGAPLRRRSV